MVAHNGARFLAFCVIVTPQLSSLTLLGLTLSSFLRTALAEQDTGFYGMLVDSQHEYNSRGEARDMIMNFGCFRGYAYEHCSSLDAGPGLANEGFHWRSAGVGGGQTFCLRCCNNNRQLRMFTETWNLKCPIQKNPEVDPQAFEMEFHFVKRKTPNGEDLTTCSIPRRSDKQRVVITRKNKTKPMAGQYRLGIPACSRIRNRKYSIYRPKTNAPTPSPTPWTPHPTPAGLPRSYEETWQNLTNIPQPTPAPAPPTSPPAPPPPAPQCNNVTGTGTCTQFLPGKLPAGCDGDCILGNRCYNDQFPPHDCQKCRPGEYSDLYPPYDCLVCQTCDAGKERVNCRANDEGQCRLCPVGRYKLGEETWDSKCLACPICPAGQKRVGCGLKENGTCVDCENGRFSETVSDENYFSVASCAQCALCPTGWWRANCKQTSGQCRTCQTCPNGRYRSLCGSCLTPPSASLDATVKSMGSDAFAGYEGESCGTTDRLQRLSPGTCKDCPYGKFKLAGVQQTERWNDQCDYCQPCAPGQQRVGCTLDSPGTCEDCPPGQYKVGSNRWEWDLMCAPCRHGYVQPYAGQERCILPHCNKWDKESKATYWTDAIEFNAFGDVWEELRIFNGTQRPAEGRGESVASKLVAPAALLRNHTLNDVPRYGPFTAQRTPAQTPGSLNIGNLTRYGSGYRAEADMDEISYEVTFNSLGFNAPKLQVDGAGLDNAEVRVDLIDAYDYDRDVHVGMQLHGYLLTMEVREHRGPDGFDFWREVVQCTVNTTERDYGYTQPRFLYESYRLRISAARSRYVLGSLRAGLLLALLGAGHSWWQLQRALA